MNPTTQQKESYNFCRDSDRLEGNFQISTVGMRTVRRWERNGLPVKRVNNTPRSPVVADSEELGTWILHRTRLRASRELADNRQRARELRRESQEIRKELRARLAAIRKTLQESHAKSGDHHSGTLAAFA